ncbi:hypothetical protein ACIP5Y_23405 [Nocardia sp. NPDC088792]|uniref:hypothetical protein n=1 Tax=Nocardia sp. NPDC088792 TaxID=3364332 RepID=UPI0037FC6337
MGTRHHRPRGHVRALDYRGAVAVAPAAAITDLIRLLRPEIPDLLQAPAKTYIS